jgi:uncharacterized protein YkwD/uncharacterized protein YukE
MTFLRPIMILLAFFGALFIVRGPLHNSLFPSALSWVPTDVLRNGNASSTPGIADNATSSGDQVAGSQTNGDTQKQNPISDSISNIKGVLTAANNAIKAEDSPLSLNGIIVYTNKERTDRFLPALKNSHALNLSAEKKLQDMFSNQYFEHQSPTGVSASDLIEDEDYQYIVVGENLALGNFGGDRQVVTAWMNSPGHRANILDARFQEIGVAVGKGLYKGKQQWIAVQHFAKPLSSCPGPSSDLKTKISAHSADLSGRERTLTSLKAEIDATTNFDDAYKAKVERYNNLVNEYNTYLESLKDEISTYNEQVRSFNACAGLAPVQKQGV